MLPVVLGLLAWAVVNVYSQTTLQRALNWNGTTTGCASGVNTTLLTNAFLPNSVPMPVLTLYWDSSKSQIGFLIKAKYLAEDMAYVIRFSGFNASRDDINVPGTCENRVASTYTGLTFDKWWAHRSNAGSLTSYSIYPNWATPPDNWLFFVYDCAHVGYYLSLMPSEIGSCKDPRGILETQTTIGPSGTSVYNGALYITMVTPIYKATGSGGKSGYNLMTWAFPFTFTFASSSTSTVLVQGGGNYFTVAVTNLDIITTGSDYGKMTISLSTVFYPQNYGYLTNCTLTSSTGVAIVMSGFSSTSPQAGPYFQVFSWVSPVASTIYDGVYNFSWISMSCEGLMTSSCVTDDTFTSSISVILRNLTKTELMGTFSSTLVSYSDVAFTKPQSSVFTEGNPICFKDTLTLVSADLSLYSTSIYNAYLCSPNDRSSVLPYDGNTTFGCLNTTNSISLVSRGIVTNNTYLLRAYEPKLYSFSSPYAAGLCINALPRFMFPNGSFVSTLYTQFMQIDLLVSKVPSSVHGPDTEEMAAYVESRDRRDRQIPNHMERVVMKMGRSRMKEGKIVLSNEIYEEMNHDEMREDIVNTYGFRVKPKKSHHHDHRTSNVAPHSTGGNTHTCEIEPFNIGSHWIPFMAAISIYMGWIVSRFMYKTT